MTYNNAWSTMNALNQHSFRLLDLKELVKQLEEDILRNGNGDNDLQYSYTKVIQNMIDVYIAEYDRLFDAAWAATVSANREQYDYNAYSQGDMNAAAIGS